MLPATKSFMHSPRSEHMQLPLPSGPRGVPLLGSGLRFLRDPLAFLTEVRREYGTIAHVSIPRNSFLLVSDPADIETALQRHAADVEKDAFISRVLSRMLGQGLVTSEGELWRRQRKLVAFGFTPTRIKDYAQTMVACTARSLGRWVDGDVVYLHEEMSRSTLDVVARTLLGVDLDEYSSDVAHALDALNAYLPEALIGLPESLPTLGSLRMRRGLKTLDALVFRIIANYRADGDQRKDVLSALLHAQDDDGAQMSNEQLRDEIVTLLIAGHETTALSLAHACLALSQKPEIAAAFENELDSVLAGGAPDHDAVKQLPYTTAIIKESLRLYPPAWIFGRRVLKAFELQGFPLSVDTQLVFSPWVVHRDERYFPEPETFSPERWLPNGSAQNLPKLAFLPFGAGPRLCIGQHFAMLEAVLMLATIGQRVRFEPVAHGPLRFAPTVTLRPRGRGAVARVRVR